MTTHGTEPRTLASALYVGRVRHRRHRPRRHRLSYALFMAYVDLDELDHVFSGSLLWSVKRPALAWLRRGDYFGDPGRPWAEAVRDEVEARCGRRPRGRVRLLTNPRTLGLRMNPVSFYYCFDSADRLEAVVAEITNTPWDERHLYVLHRDQLLADDERGGRESSSPGTDATATAAPWQASFDKTFHVSPFMPMDMRYRWTLQAPGDRLFFHMENHRDGDKAFDATLTMRRREISPRSLRAVLLRHPLQTARILFWIYLHAALLKLKGVRFYSHPRHQQQQLERN